MKCAFIKIDKTKCKSNCIKDSEFCYFHTPYMEKERKEASRRGGLARLHREAYHPPLQLSSPSDVRKLLNITINSILEGKMPSNNPANSIAYLSRCWLDAYEKERNSEPLNDIETLVRAKKEAALKKVFSELSLAYE